MSDIVEKIQKAAVGRLNQMATQVIADTERQVVDAIGDFRALAHQSGEVLSRFEANMNNHFDELMDREIIKEEAVFSFETLSLVQEDELDVMVALEGMVNAARNEHLAVFISFNTRLAELFPRKRIDESSNPLDPEQVANAFMEAMRPIGLDAPNSLTVYRAFNLDVLKKLDEVLKEANDILVESNVIPELGMEAPGKSQPAPTRTAPRPSEGGAFGTVEEEVFDNQEERPELFSLMQNLLHSDDPAAQPATDGTPATPVSNASAPAAAPTSDEFMIPAGMIPAATPAADADQPPGTPAPAMQPFQPQEGQTVQMVDQAKLMEILTDIQSKLGSSSPETIPGSMDEVEKLDTSQSLGEILQATQQDEGVVSAVDRQSSDIINLVTLLYEAIWQDISVPIPIKELIGRTQITIIKVALADVEFFNNENHPARAILNEFAAAGIGWTEVEALEEDPLYQKIQELVEKILLQYENDNQFFEELIEDFRAFRAEEAANSRQLEQRILKASERKERLDDIHQLVEEKIEERILGRELHEFVENLLKGPFNKFMVMLVLKEGPGGNAWKQAINTIDVLLWSVQPHEHEGDRDRLATINPRLFNNLRKAFRIATLEDDEIDELIEGLQKVQNETFLSEEDSPEENATEDSAEPSEETEATEAEEADTGEPEVHFLKAGEFDEAEPEDKSASAESSDETAVDVPGADDEPEPTAADDEEDLAEDNPYMQQVDALSVGMWVEFAGEEDSNTRCKLAAKINAIDKFIFVNRQGVKVVEKTKMGLAREVRDGTVSIISDGLLFSRALESVIGNLRESQHEQQTASAYQPDQADA